jgi:hypothetical protein
MMLQFPTTLWTILQYRSAFFVHTLIQYKKISVWRSFVRGGSFGQFKGEDFSTSSCRVDNAKSIVIYIKNKLLSVDYLLVFN